MPICTKSVQFDSTDLAEQIERLSQDQLDRLSFGVILLDRDGTVKYYSRAEAEMSGYGEIPIGKNLFAISPCMASHSFRERLETAMQEGPVDLEIGWSGDFADPDRDLRLRVISASGGDLWIFIDRDALTGGPPAH